jgi:hypothetical protein
MRRVRRSIMTNKHLIYVFEDGETWTAGPVYELRLDDEQMLEICEGSKPRHVVPEHSDQWRKVSSSEEVDDER